MSQFYDTRRNPKICDGIIIIRIIIIVHPYAHAIHVTILSHHFIRTYGSKRLILMEGYTAASVFEAGIFMIIYLHWEHIGRWLEHNMLSSKSILSCNTLRMSAHCQEQPQKTGPGALSLNVRLLLIILGSSAWGESKSCLVN